MVAHHGWNILKNKHNSKIDEVERDRRKVKESKRGNQRRGGVNNKKGRKERENDWFGLQRRNNTMQLIFYLEVKGSSMQRCKQATASQSVPYTGDGNACWSHLFGG